MSVAEPGPGPALDFAGLDEEALTALARRAAALLEPGDVVVLRGEVGAGKTTFVRAAAGALGVREPVTSPTYQLARRYDGRLAGGTGREISVNHLDLYRLEGIDPRDALEPDEYVTGEGGGVTFIEWADPVLDLLPEGTSVVEMLHQTPATRRVRLTGPLAGRMSE